MLEKIIAGLGLAGLIITCLGFMVSIFIDIPTWIFGLAAAAMLISIVYDERHTDRKRRGRY